ncbi:hypothetical protein MMC11_002133 [Xylographa trunciseda]|nr:hypothetical protein [Xylographa trunciseda]
MLYSHLLTRESALFAILFSVALASPAAQNSPVAGVATTPAAPAAAAATSQPPCLGVGASIIPGLDTGTNSGTTDHSGDGSGSTSGDGTNDGSIDPYSSNTFRRRDLFPDEMDNFLYERQDLGMSGSGSSDTTNIMNGGPISVPPNTTFCGWLGGMGMQSDMVNLNPGVFQLTWQNITGDGHVSINFAQAGSLSTWAPQYVAAPDEWPTVESFPNDGVQYQVVYYGAYPSNGLSWFLTQVG